MDDSNAVYKLSLEVTGRLYIVSADGEMERVPEKTREQIKDKGGQGEWW